MQKEALPLALKDNRIAAPAPSAYSCFMQHLYMYRHYGAIYKTCLLEYLPQGQSCVHVQTLSRIQLLDMCAKTI